MNTNPVALIFIFTAGLAAGSFLNVIIYRVPRGGSVIRPRSSCPACRRVLRWYENIPLLSYIFLKGKCAGCGKKISPRYPFIELSGGILALLCFYYSGFTLDLLFIYPFIMSLIAVTLIDWEHKIIPDSISLPFILIGFIWAYLSTDIALSSSFYGALAGGGSLYLVGLTYKSFRKTEGMGGGDVKLMAMIGAFLGIRLVLPVILVASFFGALYGIFLLRKGGTGRTAVPFGSFLAPAGILCLLLGDFFISWYFLNFY
ncbi:MAG TPA: prepilin peptidase [Candidatus Krumholzibacteriaceae bacterium]|nr:prepilin peptidase [Candidatus Krumholzibacteriaceae bacterium]